MAKREAPGTRDLRAIRGYILAGQKRDVRVVPQPTGLPAYYVPSSREPGVAYDVFVDVDGRWICSPCPDFEGDRWCKHIYEVLYRFYPNMAPQLDSEVLRDAIMANEGKPWYQAARRFPRKPYEYEDGPAESTSNDHALEAMDERIPELVQELAARINRKFPKSGVGRHGIGFGDRVAQMVLRSLHGKSMRRYRPTLRRLAADGIIGAAPCKSSQSAWSTDEATTEKLEATFAMAARVYRLMEEEVIIDSSGFSPFFVANWRDSNYGEKNFRSRTMWFKLHVIVGRRSGAILGFAVTPYRGAGVTDEANLLPLIQDLKNRDFGLVHTVIADNIYLTDTNIKGCKALGIRLVGPLKGRNYDKKTGLPREAVRVIDQFAKQNPRLSDELNRVRSMIEGVFSRLKHFHTKVASIGTQAERDEIDRLIEEASRADSSTLADHQARIAKASLFTSRQNEFITWMIVQVLMRTVSCEHEYRRTISYAMDSAFSWVREFSPAGDAA